eukprot:Platyproteum_vivax@DN17401_c0_g1_i1.p1
MVKRPSQEVVDPRESMVENRLAEIQNALFYMNQQIGCGGVLHSLAGQEYDQGPNTQRFGRLPKRDSTHYSEELQSTIAKLRGEVQTITQSQSERELRFVSMWTHLTLKIEGESRKFSEFQMNLEAANKGLQTEVQNCKSDISSAHEEISDLKQKLNNARSDLTDANVN